MLVTLTERLARMEQLAPMAALAAAVQAPAAQQQQPPSAAPSLQEEPAWGEMQARVAALEARLQHRWDWGIMKFCTKTMIARPTEFQML